MAEPERVPEDRRGTGRHEGHRQRLRADSGRGTVEFQMEEAMNWVSAITIMLLAGVAAWLVARRRERRHILTEEALPCPLHDCRATLTVRVDPRARAGGRYLDVAACSLHPAPLYARPARVEHFSDLAPCEPYRCAVCEP